MPEISIITPVYQAEKFLKKCVDKSRKMSILYHHKSKGAWVHDTYTPAPFSHFTDLPHNPPFGIREMMTVCSIPRSRQQTLYNFPQTGSKEVPQRS